MSPKLRIGLGILLLLIAGVTAVAQQGANTKLVTIQLQNATIAQAMETLFKDTGYKYDLEPGATGTVSISLQDAPFDTALQAILSAVTPPLTYHRDENGVFLISQKQNAEAVRSEPTTSTEAAPPVMVKPVEPVPTVCPDTIIIKRTPVINGQIDRGEWDKFFSFDYSGIQATTYVNWDDNNIYIASESTSPVDLLVTLDANNDGWFHGADNFELIARRAQDGEEPTLSVSRYQSQGAIGTGGVPLTAAEASTFVMKAGSAKSSYVYELAIPRSSVPGLELRPGRKIGLKVAIGVPTGDDVQWVPTAPLGEVQQVELVSAKASPNATLVIDADIRDKRVTPGEELIARIKIRNPGTVASLADTIVVGGEGKTAKLLGSELIRIDGILPGRSTTFTFHTRIPQHSQLGSAAFGVEVRAGDELCAASLFSFDILPPFDARIDTSGPQDKLSGYYRIAVIVKNNRQEGIEGKVKLCLPEGWAFRKSEGEKDFYIPTEDGEEAIVYRVIPCKGATGAVKLQAEVKVGKESATISGTLNM